MDLVFIDVFVVDAYKRYDIPSRPLSHSGRLQGERAGSLFTASSLSLLSSGTQRLQRVLDNKSEKSYKTETEAATPSALSDAERGNRKTQGRAGVENNSG